MSTRLVQIEKPVYGGAFLARIDRKAVFVPLALPGEQMRVRVVEQKRGYENAEVEQLITAAPERVAATCAHFGACGGCHYQHTDYLSQLRFKQAVLRETLGRAGVRAPEEIELLAGQPWGYRNRIRLGFDAAGRPGYRERRSHGMVPISQCPIAAPLLVQAALRFAEIAADLVPALGTKEISLFCNADQSQVLGTVFASSSAARQFDNLAEAMRSRIPALHGLVLVVTGSGDKRPQAVAGWGADFLDYQAAGFRYRVDHGSFFQVNRWLIDVLVERVASGHRGRLAWDLYAGVGLFARKLTESFERVVAVESEPSSTPALELNLLLTSGRAVAADTLAFLHRRPKGQKPELIIVDPPRAGLGAETTTQLANVASPSIIYVSCDPATLARDLGALTASGYAIETMILADLFPQTYHIETVVKLGLR
jgi:23S rRNA (uracil1939-C5)-methyltransferase